MGLTTLDTTRTFLALTLDAEPLRACSRLIAHLRYRVDGVRWIPADNLHVTLAFLGDVVAREIPELCDAVAEVCARHHPFELGLAGMGAFPDLRRPRVLWIGVDHGVTESARLEESLSRRLASFGYRRENRAYVPHLTIGRIKGNLRWKSSADKTLAELATWTGGTSEVMDVKVMSSELSPSGPKYRTLATCGLAGIG